LFNQKKKITTCTSPAAKAANHTATKHYMLPNQLDSKTEHEILFLSFFLLINYTRNLWVTTSPPTLLFFYFL
jgi:hypothetical protein